MCLTSTLPFLSSPLLSAHQLAQLTWLGTASGTPTQAAARTPDFNQPTGPTGHIVRIGDYIIGDAECPLLYGVPDIRY